MEEGGYTVFVQFPLLIHGRGRIYSLTLKPMLGQGQQKQNEYPFNYKRGDLVAVNILRYILFPLAQQPL